MRDPLAAWLRPGPPAAAGCVASALARALLPPEATDPEPPSWLRADQRLSFRRVVAAVRRHHGALLADGVGTGKTFIALAAATVQDGERPVLVLAPAALRQQWEQAAARVRVPVILHSHETLSRGRVPTAGGGVVVIDESHRFRNALTRRYETVAPWCLGRRGILLSATPMVNRPDDLIHQLLLVVRDDTLARSGVPSLRALPGGRLPAAIAELVITGEDRSASLPSRGERSLTPRMPAWMRQVLSGVAQLRLSGDAILAGLLRSGLLRALASSPAAVAMALGRLGALLRHASDAAATGRRLTRETIRRSVGADPGQLVFWPLVAETPEPADHVELVVSDLPRVAELERLAAAACRRHDPKAAALATALADRRPSLVFATSLATVRYLRDRLGRSGIAWCTGESAGIDRVTLTRDGVLDWFRGRPPARSGPALRPTVLLATDVAAEGLDLPLVERVVHYDLPWTAVRLEQRAGRALRLESRLERVEVIRCIPPVQLSRALRQEAILREKAGLPALLGLDGDPGAAWRLRSRIAADWSECPPLDGVARVAGRKQGVVAGYRIRFRDGTTWPVVLARESGQWTDDLVTIARLLEAARGSDRGMSADREQLRTALRGFSVRVAATLRAAHGAGVGPEVRSAALRALRRRLIRLAAAAARVRDRERLALLERGIRHLRRGHTAGEALRLEQWARHPDAMLPGLLARLPPEPPFPIPEGVSLIGVLLVEAASAPS